jgi:hypothetical protein
VDDKGLLDLIATESDPVLRKALEQYRGAEIELNAAAETLERSGRTRWAQAAASRARDVAWQAQRYMRIERERSLKLSDFMDDAETNPRGYQTLEPGEYINTSEAVFDTDPPPAAAPDSKRVHWALHVVFAIAIAVTLWLMRLYALTVD